MKIKSKNKKVLFAMSGGVDSSVSSLLMNKQGFQVIGDFMKNWSDSKDDIGECTWKQDRQEAIKISSMLNIPLITLDFEKEYRKLVIEEMFKSYKKGITPNPDVDCNQKIKFPLLRKAAKKLGAEFIVTGHYAKIKKIKDKYQLLRSEDESKDQSYFLYRLSQEDLKHSLFPIGEYTKKQIREIAKKNNFPNYDRKGTVGICFIGKVNMKKFLQVRIPAKRGKILNPEGEKIGEHDGIYYHTLGQKMGPKFGLDILKDSDDKKQIRRWYVAKKNLKKNEIVAAPEGHEILYKKEILIKQPHWISEYEIEKLFSQKENSDYNKGTLHGFTSLSRVSTSKKSASDSGASAPRAGRVGKTQDITIKLHARIRQVGELLPCKLTYNKDEKKFKVALNKAITGVSEGQAIVLYKNKICLGGGVIGFS
ncbi:MAG: tRNA 2-thiouridine(34) synthase MnmA [Nanoarchaeota archaeon]|nr:tRNA 2-thiouridine(34) synthase MnmA [Nanoarchaeota archaeon]